MKRIAFATSIVVLTGCAAVANPTPSTKPRLSMTVVNAQFDRNGDQKISLEEYLEINITTVFDKIDTDGNGTLSENERVQNVCDRWRGLKFKESGDSIYDACLKEIPQKVRDEQSKENFIKRSKFDFKKIDKNNDGFLDDQEY